MRALYSLIFLVTVSLGLAAPSASEAQSLTRQEVVQLQGMLSDMGYNLSVDGVAGPGTRRELQRFYRDTTPAGQTPPRAVVDGNALFRVRFVFERGGHRASPVRAAPDSGAKPSFNCARASIPTEFAICGSAQLAGLDNAIARAYNSALARMSSGQKSRFQADQRAWLASRNRCGGDVGCLTGVMSARLNQIR